MEEISFIHFYTEFKAKVNDLYLFKLLTPFGSRFFKINNCYFALSGDEKVFIDMVFGKIKIEDLENLRKALIVMGVKEVYFNTSVENSKVISLANCFNCEEYKEIKNFYTDNSSSKFYKIII